VPTLVEFLTTFKSMVKKHCLTFCVYRVYT